MSTTALVVEHLIIGLQSAAWITLIVFTLFGLSWFDSSVLKDFSTAIVFLSAATFYPIGVCIDEMADRIFKSWMKNIREMRFKNEGVDPEYVTTMYLLQRNDIDSLTTYLSYVRTRIRITRSTALNLILITFSCILFTIRQLRGLENLGFIIFIEIAIGLSLTGITVWVWRQLCDTYSKQVARAYKVSTEQSSAANNALHRNAESSEPVPHDIILASGEL